MSLWIRALEQRAIESGLPPSQWDEFLAWIGRVLQWKGTRNDVAASSALVDVPRLIKEYREWRMDRVDVHVPTRRRRSGRHPERTSRLRQKKNG